MCEAQAVRRAMEALEGDDGFAARGGNLSESPGPELHGRGTQYRPWVGDITYIRTTAGWQYLATVIDLYKRMIVGWALAGHMRSELVEDAVKMAYGHREVENRDHFSQRPM